MFKNAEGTGFVLGPFDIVARQAFAFSGIKSAQEALCGIPYTKKEWSILG